MIRIKPAMTIQFKLVELEKHTQYLAKTPAIAYGSSRRVRIVSGGGWR
jgi:hypothetical protein